MFKLLKILQQEIQVRNQIQLIFGDANMKVSIYLVYTLIGLYKFDFVPFFSVLVLYYFVLL